MNDGRIPKGVSGEAAQVGLQDEGQGGGPEARESARDTALASGRPAESTRSRRATVRGRARDRENRGKRGEGREGGAFTWHGRGLPRGQSQEGEGTGREHREATRPEHMCSAIVRACREEGTTR